jgi:hypothetical protein
MADYYSVIRRGVAALEINTFEDRSALYNRARVVQKRQLSKRPFNKAHDDRERLMLEDAISRVEAEATNKRMITYASPRREPVQPKRHRPSFVSTPDYGVSQDITGITVAGGPLMGRVSPAPVPRPAIGTGLQGLIAAFVGLLGWRRKKRKQLRRRGTELTDSELEELAWQVQQELRSVA